MGRAVQQLKPPNPQAHTILPGTGVSAARRASSHHSVIAVYRDGISFIDQLGAMSGFLSLIAVWGATMPLMLFYYAYRHNEVPVAGVFMLIVCFFIFRFDNAAFKYHPVLFNRASKKIHVFVDQGVTWWRVWQFVPDVRIDTWDWECARGEIAQFTVATNAGVARTENALIFAITDFPEGQDVVARFSVGLTSSYDQGQSMIERWEHIRQFMNGDGPHLAPGDHLFHDPSTVGIFAALTWGQPLIGPGSKQYWNGSAINGWWFFTIPVGILLMGFLPFTVISGLIRLVLYKLKPEPKWPKEKLAEVGPLTASS